MVGPLISVKGYQLDEGFIGQFVALLDHGIRVRIPEFTDQCFRCLLMRIDGEPARSFYEIEALQGAWSVRELERQVGSMLYERLAKSRDEAAVKVSSRGLIIEKPADATKDSLRKITLPSLRKTACRAVHECSQRNR